MSNRKTKAICVSSGKGGVGKSTLVGTLAISMAKHGKRVLMIDGDFGMANLDIFFRVRAEHNFSDVINGEAQLADVIVPIYSNLDLLPGGSGIYGLSHLDVMKKMNLFEQISSLDGEYDYVLIDTAPGLSDHVLHLNSCAQINCLVITPEPSSFSDAYALMKVLRAKYGEKNFKIIINMVRSENEAQMLYQRLLTVTRQFLDIRLEFLGHVPQDVEIRHNNRAHLGLTQLNPKSISCYEIRRIADRLLQSRSDSSKGGLQFFIQGLTGAA